MSATPDPTSLPWPCRHAVMAAMDGDTRGAWRQVSKQACSDVYEAARSLTWNAQRHEALAFQAVMRRTPPPPTPSALPTALFAKLPNLLICDCSGMKRDSLRSIDGLPSTLQAFICKGMTITSFAPLSLCPSLRELCLDWTYFKDYAMLSPCTALVKLSLRGSNLGAAGAQKLAPALSTSLQHLHLRHCSVDAEGARVLAPAIRALPHLRTLDLMANYLGEGGAAALGPTIQVGMRWSGSVGGGMSTRRAG